MSELDAKEIVVTPEMIEAGMRALRNSGAVEFDELVNEPLMERIINSVLDARRDRHLRR